MGNDIRNLCNSATGDTTNQVNLDIQNLNPYDFPLESLTNDQINRKLTEEHPDFFNRSNEIEYLSDLLKNPAALYVTLGPSNTGKSTLLNYAMRKFIMENKIRLIKWNFKEKNFSSYRGLYNIIKPTLELVEKEMSASLTGGVKYVYKKPENISVEDFNNALTDFSDAISAHLKWDPLKKTVLLIDEAQILQTLETSNEEKEQNLFALKGLFRWLETITKEKPTKERIYVFMASSEQFFFKWVQNYMQDKCRIILIVDLSKIQAQNFYNIKKVEYSLQNCKISFNELYKLTGGSMHLMERCLGEMKSPKEIMNLEGLDLYTDSKGKLKKYFTLLDLKKDLKKLVFFTLAEMKKKNFVFCTEKTIENFRKDGVWQLLENPSMNLTSIFQYRPRKAEFDEHDPETNIPKTEGCIFFENKAVQYLISNVPFEELLLTKDKE